MRNSIKKIAVVLLALLVMIPVGMIGISADDAAATGTVYTATEGWGDTDGDGVFEIATPGDLLALAENRTKNGNNSYKDKTIVLTADIDMNPGWDASSKTAPANVWPGMFYMNGTFDGQGHTIKGLYIAVEGDNATFFTLAETSALKNVRFENSYFCAKAKADGTGGNGAGLCSAIRGSTPTFENVYADIICEAAVNAGGFVSWFNCSAAYTPKVTINNCVFAGTVYGGKTAGGFVGTNDHPESNTTSKGTYDVILTNCANYGTVTCGDATKAAGFVGECAGGATLTNCYNAGKVGTAFVNITPATLENLEKKPVVVTLNDCYYDSTKSEKAIIKTAEATTLAISYEGQESTTARAATIDELLAAPAFKPSETNAGWTKDSLLNIAIPAGIAALSCTHEFEPTVIAPTCAEQGYTLNTCKKCGMTNNSDFVEKVEHTPAEDWVVDKEPTEEFAGSRHQECSVCGSTLKTEILPMLTPDTDTDTDTDTEPGETTPDSAGDTTADTDGEDKGGCGSAIGASVALVAVAVLGTAVVSKKRK